MNFAADSAYYDVETQRLARVLDAVPRVIAGACGLALADGMGAGEVSTTDGGGGVVVLWDGPVREIMGDVSGVAEHAISGTAYIEARPVGLTSNLGQIAAGLLIRLLAMRNQGTGALAADDARLDFADPVMAYPTGEARGAVRFTVPLRITIRLQTLALPEEATTTTTSDTLIAPLDLRQR